MRGLVSDTGCFLQINSSPGHFQSRMTFSFCCVSFSAVFISTYTVEDNVFYSFTSVQNINRKRYRNTMERYVILRLCQGTRIKLFNTYKYCDFNTYKMCQESAKSLLLRVVMKLTARCSKRVKRID